MKRGYRGNRVWLLVLVCGVWGLTTGCVAKSEYVRMKQSLQQRLEQQQAKNRQLQIENRQCEQKNRALTTSLQNQKAAFQSQKTAHDKCTQLLKGKARALHQQQQELEQQQALLKRQTEALRNKEQLLQEASEQVKRLRAELNQVQKVYEELRQRLRGMLEAGNLKIEMRHGQLVLQLPEKILFDLAKDDVKPAGIKALEKVTYELRQMKHRWRVVGHADITGPARFNWRLSARRALSVLFVMLKAGMPPAQVSIVGYGQYQPTAPNDTRENRALNRRTELVLAPNLTKIIPAINNHREQ